MLLFFLLAKWNRFRRAEDDSSAATRRNGSTGRRGTDVAQAGNRRWQWQRFDGSRARPRPLDYRGGWGAIERSAVGRPEPFPSKFAAVQLSTAFSDCTVVGVHGDPLGRALPVLCDSRERNEICLVLMTRDQHQRVADALPRAFSAAPKAPGKGSGGNIYPEITFTPDRIEGKVNLSGHSEFKLHGIFTIHGATHELTMNVKAAINGNHLTATADFNVPYVQWGLKNPSTLFLRVNDTVPIKINAVGEIKSS